MTLQDVEAPALAWRLRSFHDELAAHGIEHAFLRRSPGDGAEERPLLILVAPNDLSRFNELARRHALTDGSDAGAADDETPRLRPITRLLYGGGGGWLTTSEDERHILGRAVALNGVRRLSPADELVDTLLHCVLDLGAFPEPHRRHLRALLEQLRAEAPLAGRAAERTQRELSPAITWSELLDHVLHGRWQALLARRSRLRRRLLSGRPVRSILRWATPDRERPDPGRPSETAPPTGDRASAAEAPAEEAAGADADEGRRSAEKINRRQIRGSGLLLAGRGLSTGMKFIAELLVVRYLSTAAYGSWTWALSAVVLLQSFSTIGLNRAVPRFVPIHLERRERDELFGLLTFVLGSLALLGALIVAAFYAFPTWVAGLAGASPGQSLDVLFIVIFLVPVEGVGAFFTQVCAAFGNSRAIFVRRYVLHPGLRLTVALILVALEANVRLLAYGYLLSSLAGVGYYSVTVYRELRQWGLLSGAIERIRLPVKRVLSYTVPVMGADWFRTLMVTPAPLLLGYFSDMSTVALYQVAVPLVALNTQASQSFAMLFEPSASTVIAREDRRGLETLYWRSAVWVAVLSFPGFAVSFAAAEPLTVLLYGERYAAAAPILSLLAIGTFIDVSAGFNDATLRVAGKIRWLMGVNALGATLNVGLNLLLIPRMGALGAGIATGMSLLVYALLKQLCLWRATGVRPIHPQYLRPYLVMGLLTVGLVILRVLWPDQPLIVIAGVLGAITVVLLLARSTLSISETFPEIERFPFLKRLLG